MTSLPHLAERGPLAAYAEPSKRIHDGPDVQSFLQSRAYRDITTCILQLNRSLVPRKRSADGTVTESRLDQLSQKDLPPRIVSIQTLVLKLESLVAEAPPDTGPRRFGNVSFRKWYHLVEGQAGDLLRAALPVNLHPAILELKAYLLGSFGSAQRLDYGTGHELSYIAFLACLRKLDFFTGPSPTSRPDSATDSPGVDSDGSTHDVDRQIVLALFTPYLRLVRTLIITYNLEPAGSHGVWGLDDNSFLPYLFGSAQLCPPISLPDSEPPTPTPTSGSFSSAPDPTIVTKSNLVDKEATNNLYFGAIKFIYTVKKGPFWEHSPILFDISGIKDGWGKINKGLIKMYDAEVLGKFPVVQHFPFGNILKWEKDPEAEPPIQTTHQQSQPLRDPMAGGGSMNATAMRPSAPGGPGTAAPWANTGASGASTRMRLPPKGFVNGGTQAPWARPNPSHLPPGTRLNSSRMPPPSVSRPPPAQTPAHQRGPARPLHSQASQPSSTLNYSRQSLQPEDGRPISAATANEEVLKDKVAETIPEDKETS